jgi:hypothetical protein
MSYPRFAARHQNGFSLAKHSPNPYLIFPEICAT